MRNARRFSGFCGQLAERAEVHAGGEHRAGAADDDAVHGGVVGRGAQRLADGGDQLAVEGVALLRAVEHDVADGAVLLGDHEGHCGSVARVGLGHVAAHPDRPRPPRAPRLARGRRRPRQAIAKAVRSLKAPAKVNEALSGTWLGHPVHPLLILRPDGQLDERRAARLARRRGRRDGRRPAGRRRARGRACRPSPPATPTGPTPSPPATPCAASGSSTRPATRPPPCCSPPRWPPARPAPAAAASCSRWPAWAPSAPAATSAATSPTPRASASTSTTFEDYPEDWTQALADAALGEGEMRAVDVDGVAILIARRGGRGLRASNTCVHRGGSLADGELDGDCVHCPLHGSLFRLDDGSVEQGPAAYPQPALEARVRDGSIEVRAPQPSGDSSRAYAEPREHMAEIKTVGVLGAGLMGHGIAQVAAQAGYDVVLREVDDDRARRRASGRSRSSSRARSRRASSSRTTPTPCAAASRRRRLRRPRRLRPRDRGDHRGPRAQARDVARARRDRQARGRFATNTSSLAVIDQAAATSRPERFLGLHFFNPAQVMKLVEVIRAVTTSDEAFQAGLEFARQPRQAAGPDARHGRLHRQPPARALPARRDPRLRGGRRLGRGDRRRR